MENAGQWGLPAADEFPVGIRRLLLVASGSSNASFLPLWVNWFQFSYPETELRIVLTRSAQRFVTRDALSVLTNRLVFEDVWSEEPQTRKLHVELAQWPDAVAVYPAGMHFIARLAQGLADTPATMALQCTTAPIALAAALPPGGWDSPAMADHRERLAKRRNVVVLPPVPGLSMTTGRRDGGQPAHFPTAIRRLEELRARLAAEDDPKDGSGAVDS
ncbi:flavoprotein [Streptomyces sp. NPDC090021]|uniref:flavoprotein n=1 Tax=Streptomyces sp. NPDC090021 TaxID=3365919 RepID=UPI00380931A0